MPSVSSHHGAFRCFLGFSTNIRKRTSTAHTTVTVTKAPVFVTATDVVTNTMVNTVTQTDVTVVTTIEDTVTFIQPTEVDVSIQRIQVLISFLHL